MCVCVCIFMITSGKADERQINSKIKRFMYLKIKISAASAVQLACLGPNFFVFLIHKKNIYIKQFILSG